MNTPNTIVTPSILTESRNGISTHSIADEMFKRREISLFAEVNDATADSLTSQILELAREDPSKEITFYINSPGGSVTSGLVIYDVMMAVPCPIRTICLGEAASMGAVLFAAGSERDILPHASVMIHDPLRMNISGSALSVRSETEQLMHTREVLCSILAEHTGKTIEEIYARTCEDTYFYGNEAVDFGLADRVITSLAMPTRPTVKTSYQKEAII